MTRVEKTEIHYTQEEVEAILVTATLVKINANATEQPSFHVDITVRSGAIVTATTKQEDISPIKG